MTKKAKKAMAQEINRTFETAPETIAEQWWERLETFFHESGAGEQQDWQWKLEAAEGADLQDQQCYYDLSNLLTGNIRVYLKGRAAKLRGQRSEQIIRIDKGFIITPTVYENTACFRYAEPSEG
ncbi:MAG: hypothetical protein N2Z74_02695 [Syntrophales bacterium]|nr:hypothetical protein [Syntrophales bacterium]